MQYFSDIIQSETLIWLQVNLENSKLHVKRDISPSYATSSPFKSKINTCQMIHNVGECSALGKENFRHFFGQVTVA